MILRASSKKVTTIKNLPMAGTYLIEDNHRRAESHVSIHPNSSLQVDHTNIRSHGIGQGIQPIFNLTRLLTDGIEWTWIVGGLGTTSSTTERMLVSQVVASCSSYLRHPFFLSFFLSVFSWSPVFRGEFTNHSQKKKGSDKQEWR